MGLWKAVASVTLMATVTLVVAVLVAVTVPTLLCHRGSSTEELQEALNVTNRSLAASRERWQRCREELRELQGRVLELEQALANVTRLEEQNRVLGTEVTQQREQLAEEKSFRAQLQLQIRLLQEQLQDMRSPRSAGHRPALSPGVPMLLLLLLGMLLL